MSLQFLDGMDAYGSASDITKRWWITSGGTYAFGSTAGRFGGGAISCIGSANANILAARFAPLTLSGSNTLNFGMSVKSAAAGTPVSGSASFAQYHGNASVENTIWVFGVTLSHNYLSAYSNDAPNTAHVGSAAVTDGNWHWVEGSPLFATSVGGYLKLYVDGVLDINFSGVTCASSTYLPTALYSIKMRPGVFATSSGTAGYIDDVIIYDSGGSTVNSFPLGLKRISTLQPNADGDLTQFTPSSMGSHYSLVNGGLGGAGYVSDTGSGNKDLYHFGQLPFTPATVDAVVVNMYGQNPGVGAATANVVLKTSGSSTSGASDSFYNSSNALFQSAFFTDVQGNPWTAVSVNAIQAGIGD